MTDPAPVLPEGPHAAKAMHLLFDWESVHEGEIASMCDGMPRKLVRWLAIHHPDNRVRITLYRLTGVPIGIETVINAGVTLYDEFEGLVRFGARVAVAGGATFIASSNANNSRLAEHDYVRQHLIRKAAIDVGDDAWIGASATILPGVTLGARVIVGAGAVVTDSVPADVVVAGIPARIIRQFDRKEMTSPRAQEAKSPK